MEALREEMRAIARAELERELKAKERTPAPAQRDRQVKPPHYRTPHPTLQPAEEPTASDAQPPSQPKRAPTAPGTEPSAQPRPPAPTAELEDAPEYPSAGRPDVTDDTLKVLELSTALEVDRDEREPRHMSNRFSVSDEGIWAYAVLANDSSRQRQVQFVWKQEGVDRGRSKLPVGSNAARWRTWSRKRLGPESAGRWTVELQDENGLALASRSFEITP